MMESETKIIIGALRQAAQDIYDVQGTTSSMMVEAAERLEEAEKVISDVVASDQLTRDVLRRDANRFLMHGVEAPKHPCINQCTPTASICRGCYRTDEERANWAAKTPYEQLLIINEIKACRLPK